MTSANDPNGATVAYCRQCGRPLSELEKREWNGTVYCAEHVPVVATAAPPLSTPEAATTASSPYTAPIGAPLPGAINSHSPVLALILGFIPGVGAIYNGQYAKGLIHAVVFGLLVSLLSSNRYGGGMEPLLGILLAAWVFYMAFEAFHTAKMKRGGIHPGEVSGLLDVSHHSGKFPVGALVLIVLGGVLLLDTTNLISFDRILHLWPIGLIAIGAYMLYERMSSVPRTGAEARNDQQ